MFTDGQGRPIDQYRRSRVFGAPWLAIPNVGAGTHTCTARYDGDANYTTLLYAPVVVTAH